MMPQSKLMRSINYIRTFAIVAGTMAVIIITLIVKDLSDTVNRQSNTISGLSNTQECLFKVDAEVNVINDRIGAKTAQIFVSAIRNPGPSGQLGPEVVQLGNELDQLIVELQPAIEKRANALKVCDRGSQ